MASLVAYDSDDAESDHDANEDEESERRSSTEPIKVAARVIDAVRAEPSDKPESAHESTSEVGADFFGLNDSDNEIGYDSGDDPVVVKARKVDLGAEVPGSSYWKDFDPVVTCDESKPNPKNVERLRPKPVPFVRAGSSTDDSVRALGRKIYFVHHLVSQNLTRESHSKPRKQEITIAAHGGVVNGVRWCRRRDYSHLAATCSSDRKVKLWNLFNDQSPFLGTVHEHDKAVSSISWSSCGRNILSGSYDRTAVVSSVERSEVISKFEHSNHVTKVAYNPDDHHCFVSISNDVIYSWDLRTAKKPLRLLRHPRKEVRSFFDFAFINGGKELAVSTDSCEHNLCIFDIKSGALVSLEQEIYPERYTCPRLRTMYNCFLAQTQGNYVCEFSCKRPYKLNKYKRFQGHSVAGYPVGFDVTCDSKTLISGSADSLLYLYDWFTGKCFSKVNTDLGVCLDVACHPVMGNVVVVGSWGGQIALVK